MFDGHIVGEADPATATERELGLLMAGVTAETRRRPAHAPKPLPRWADIACCRCSTSRSLSSSPGSSCSPSARTRSWR
jgi:hypothetical protein